MLLIVGLNILFIMFNVLTAKEKSIKHPYQLLIITYIIACSYISIVIFIIIGFTVTYYIFGYRLCTKGYLLKTASNLFVLP